MFIHQLQDECTRAFVCIYKCIDIQIHYFMTAWCVAQHKHSLEGLPCVNWCITFNRTSIVQTFRLWILQSYCWKSCFAYQLGCWCSKTCGCLYRTKTYVNVQVACCCLYICHINSVSASPTFKAFPVDIVAYWLAWTVLLMHEWMHYAQPANNTDAHQYRSSSTSASGSSSGGHFRLQNAAPAATSLQTPYAIRAKTTLSCTYLSMCMV